MDKKYWNRFYIDDEVTENSSDFSQFCVNNYKKDIDFLRYTIGRL